MNQFRVKPDASADFERAWAERESFVSTVPGFRTFHLLRGPIEDGAQLYASHTVWDSEAAFTAWTQSEEFRKAHAQGGKTVAYLAGPPKFVGWQAVDLDRKK